MYGAWAIIGAKLFTVITSENKDYYFIDKDKESSEKLRKLLSIFGNTSSSINLFIKVDLPVLTGPTTPTYMSPSVLFAMS